MEVILSVPRGFCAGVVRAVDIVDLCLKRFGPPIYVKHQIVHNPHVVESLENRGAITVENVGEIPEGSVVVFSAHGSPPEDFAVARQRSLRVIDATCPLVLKVHNEAKKFHQQKRPIIFVGHRGHQEVRGTMGQAPAVLVDEEEELNIPEWDRGAQVVVLTQTTLSVADTARAVQKIQDRFPSAIVRNDICYATSNRQAAAKVLAEIADLVLVIGSPNSSNCHRLREVVAASGTATHLISGPTELDMSWVEGCEKIGITAGASTPESLVEAVVAKLNPGKITEMDGVLENVNFSLPRELTDNT